jgi:small neutral amino acid transporter SnatA (MarC family)
LLIRPFFFDAEGVLGLIVSLENLLFLILITIIIFHPRLTTQLARKIPFVRYAVVSSAVITMVLALGYYNVGLGIRQKATMITPGLLVAFVALQALRQAHRMAGAAAPLPHGKPSFG